LLSCFIFHYVQNFAPLPQIFLPIAQEKIRGPLSRAKLQALEKFWEICYYLVYLAPIKGAPRKFFPGLHRNFWGKGTIVEGEKLLF
jgi:hypothetical protein